MNTIDRLRKLLDSFYEGSASVEAISEIRAIFDSLKDLPDDLAADKEVFDAMSDPQLDDACVPRDVAKLVSVTIDNLAKNENEKKSTWILWLKVSGVAAAVAVILSLGVHFMHKADLQLTDSDIHVASNDIFPADEMLVGEKEKAGENSPVQENPAAEAIGTTRKKSYGAVKSLSDVKIITDPEEAEGYVLMAMNLLSENMNRAEQAVQEPANAIKNMNQTLKDILK